MSYELDFIGVKEEKSKQNADAITFRWLDNDTYKIIVYDGGLQAHGEALENHIKKYYLSNGNKTKDAVIVSHSDQDHTSGLTTILENFDVKALYMNRPWIYAEELYDNFEVTDGRMTVKSLTKKLEDKYKYIKNLEDIARNKNIPIFEVFQGQIIESNLRVLSPSKEFYLTLITESEKTPINENRSTYVFESLAHRFINYVKKALEKWNVETLKEDVSTSAENEMSTILLGQMEDENFCLLVMLV